MDKPKPNTLINADNGDNHYISVPYLFIEKYGSYPSLVSVKCYFDLPKLIAHLLKTYKITKDNGVFNHVVDKNQVACLKDGVFFLKDGLAIKFDVNQGDIETEFSNNYYEYEGTTPKKIEKEHSSHCKIELELFYDNENVKLEDVEKAVEDLLKFRVEPKRKSELNFLCVEEGELILKTLDIKKPKLDVRLNYGAKFAELHDYMYDRMVGEANKNKGLVLLYGNPGTGKTFYIRHLISLLSDKKKVIYVPPDMVTELSSPKFLPFLMTQQNSILIIEDGENVIKSRKSGQNQAVSNLLNAADGLLSDALNIQILCTFNCSLNDVDEALLRKGRLIAKHEFKALTKEDAQILLDHLKIKFTATTDMSLADIYNCADKDFTEKKKGVGF